LFNNNKKIIYYLTYFLNVLIHDVCLDQLQPGSDWSRFL